MECENCKSIIPAENFELHESRCKKNTVVCEKCEKILPKTKLDEHFDEFHKQKTCDDCGETFEVGSFSSHVCNNPPQKCQYCEATYPTLIFADHLVTCENRTTLCSKCNKYIKNKDSEGHMKIDCQAKPFIPLTNFDFLNNLGGVDMFEPSYSYKSSSSSSSYSSNHNLIFPGEEEVKVAISDDERALETNFLNNISVANTIRSKRNIRFGVRVKAATYFYSEKDYQAWLPGS